MSKIPYGVYLFSILIIFTAIYCVPERHTSNSDDFATDDDIQDDDINANDDDTMQSPYNVIEKEDLGADWNCSLSESCIDDYQRFLILAGEYSDPISPEELTWRISNVENGNCAVLTDPISKDALKDAVSDILNIRFLLEGINERLLIVTTIREDETTDYYEKEFLFEDPYVGTFKGILLIPKGQGPFPGIVAIHGHRDNAAIYRDRFHGKEYPSHEYAILMLTMRAMGIDLFEHYVSRQFLLNGFTLIGMRTYESLLGLKYLRYLSNTIDERIGLIGHSGGSSTSNLTIRVEDGFAAYVSDLSIDYCEWGTLWEPYHCETVPELYPYHLLINDFETAATPVKEVPYGYTNGMDEIFDFFDEHLK